MSSLYVNQDVIPEISNKKMLPSLFLLLIWTSITLIVANCVLAWNLDVTLTALKTLMLVLAIYGAAGSIYLQANHLGLVAIVMVFYLGLSVLVGSQWLLLPLILQSMIFFIKVIKERKEKIWPDFGSLLGIILATLLIIAAGQYGNFQIMENLHVATVHKDTLFHASIASMIKNYHISSTGIHGLVVIDYHVLSHALFAAFSVLGGISVLEAYGFFEIVLFSPLLIFCLSYATALLLVRPSVEKTKYTWIVICVVLLAANVLLSRWAFWDAYFVSESYTLSLIFLLLAFPSLMTGSTGLKQFIIMICLIILAGAAKGSVGIIGFGLLWLQWIFITEKSKKAKSLVFLLMASVIFYLLVIASVRSASEVMPISPLAFIADYTLWGGYLTELLLALKRDVPFESHVGIMAALSVISFFVMHFVFSWLAVFITIKNKGARTFYSNPAVLYPLGASFAGVVIVSVFLIPGGSAYYFSNVAFFISLPVVVCWVVDRKSQVKKDLEIIFCILLIVIFCGVANKEAYKKSFLVLKNTEQNNQLVSHLIALRNKTEKKNSVVYHAVDLSAPGAGFDCAAIPFIYPAVSEVAWIGVIKEESGCSYKYYGYPDYFSDKSNKHLISPVVPAGAQITLPRIGT